MKMSPDETEKWYNSSVNDDFSSWSVSSPNLQGSSNGQHLLQDSLKRFEQNANAGPQVFPDKSIPPVLFAQSGPKTPAMHRGKKRQNTADNLEVGFYRYPQKCRRLPSLGSISTQPSSSFSSIENTKLIFDNLIPLPLEVLSDPEKETSMKNVLSILADNLSLFSEKQGDQILRLLLEFPALVRNRRKCYSQFQVYRQQSSAETENIRELVENSGRDEESLKVRY